MQTRARSQNFTYIRPPHLKTAEKYLNWKNREGILPATASITGYERSMFVVIEPINSEKANIVLLSVDAGCTVGTLVERPAISCSTDRSSSRS